MLGVFTDQQPANGQCDVIMPSCHHAYDEGSGGELQAVCLLGCWPDLETSE